MKSDNTSISKANHIIALDTFVMPRDFDTSWKLLTQTEREYTYHFLRAGWEGILCVLQQNSFEAPVVFSLGTFYFHGQSFNRLKAAAMKQGVTSKDFEKFLAYFAGVYANMSTYLSFGYKKIVPDLDRQTFKKILASAPHQSQFESCFGAKFEAVLALVEEEIHGFEAPYTMINYPASNGSTALLSSNLSSEDLKFFQRAYLHKKMSEINTRSFKQVSENKTKYVISVASIEQRSEQFELEGKTVEIQYGDYSEYLSKVNQNLALAAKAARSQLQKDMITDYINHFKTGDIEIHIESQKKWVKDQKPPVETNVGFIETYLDPDNTRAEYQTLVALVNREESKKYDSLVGVAPELLKAMPWSADYQLDTFLRPDFTSLEVVAFAGSNCPRGINIPNYDIVRQNDGFKNVFLANAVIPFNRKTLLFSPEKDIALILDQGVRSLGLHIALHEMLGHGSGKIFMESKGGWLNFNPKTTRKLLSNELVTSWYKSGESWNNKFGNISTSFEECRADLCGLYLHPQPLAYQIFGIASHEIDDIFITSVLIYLRKGILGLKLFEAANNKWGQAHTQGAFVLAHYITANQDPLKPILEIDIKEDDSWFEIKLNRKRMLAEGHTFIGDILRILQEYKSTANVEDATKFYNKYSAVNDMFMRVRKIVLLHPIPYRLNLNNEIVKDEEGNFKVLKFDNDFRGIIDSMSLHWDVPRDQLVQSIMKEWRRKSGHFRSRKRS